MPIVYDVSGNHDVGAQKSPPMRGGDSSGRHSNNDAATNNHFSDEEHEKAASGNPKAGFAPPKMPNIKIKKQYSKIYRIKTKILQNLGKADKTSDEVFDLYESNFIKQQLHANRLHKEVSNYLRCARALHGASKAMYDTLSEIYEPEWVGHDLIYVQAQNSDMIWTDFCHKLQDQSLAPLTAYTQDFPEIKKKIDKRGRKLVDYDSQRHQLENLQRSNRRDEYKITRVKDQLNQAKDTYDNLNKELYEELPAIYDQRIVNSANSIQTLFSAEATFMQESCKIAQEVEAIAEKLGRESNKGTYNTKREYPPRDIKTFSPSSPSSQSSPSVWYSTSPPADQTNDSVVTASTEQPVPLFHEDLNVELKSAPTDSSESLVEKNSSTKNFAPVTPDRKKSPSPVGEGASSLSVGLTTVDPLEVDAVAPVSPVEDDNVAKVSPTHDDSETPVTPVETVSVGPAIPIETDTAIPVVPSDGEDDTAVPTMVAKEGEKRNGYPNLTELRLEDNLSSSSDPASPLCSPSPAKEPEDTTQTRPTISSPVAKEETGRPYEEIEFEDKKVNGAPPAAPPKTNGDVVGHNVVPPGATTDDLPPGVLYRVKATYKYNREDADELSFDVGDSIRVVEYDDPEEQEEGWLCGILESSNEKGLFPANFTRPM